MELAWHSYLWPLETMKLLALQEGYLGVGETAMVGVVDGVQL